MTSVMITIRIIYMLGSTHLAQVDVINYFFSVVFQAMIPVSVLVINVAVVFKVRRAATNAAADLGVQPHHHQSTSSNSAVPTVMLVAISLIYVLLYSTNAILWLILRSLPYAGAIDNYTLFVLQKSMLLSLGLMYLVFAYNFYIYLITGKMFRSELYKLCCCCISSSSSPPPPLPVVVFGDDAEVTIRVHSN